MFKSKKSLKIKKIAALVLVILVVFVFPASAVYTSGDLDTNRYYAPLRFDFEILGTTAQLTPTISYASGQSLTYTTDEQATQANSTVTSIKRSNFGVSTVGQTCVDVSYRLSFVVSESMDNFTMRITAPGGIYDFLKYGIPQISIPTGYTVSATVSYNLRFTQDQESTDDLIDFVQYTSTYTAGDNMPLIRSYYMRNGESFDIVGGVIVNDYVATLTFTSEGSSGSGTVGDAGWYHFNTVLSYPGGLIEETIGTEADAWMTFDVPVYVAGLYEGAAYEEQVSSLVFENFTTWEELEYSYDLYNGNRVLVYNYSSDTWYNVDYDLTEDGAVLTETTVRYLRFTDTLVNTLDVSNGATYAYDWLNWILDNSTYYSENPLQTVTSSDGSTYSFTDGDGGMYLHFYADRMLDTEFSSTMSDYYSYAYNNGFANGDGGFTRDYSGWIANAVSGFTSLEIFPNFSIGGVLGAIVALCLLILFLKFFAGG